MRILGIGCSHCSGVCLIENDTIVFALEEERLTRERRAKGFPYLSLSYLFQNFELDWDDLDLVCVSDINGYRKFSHLVHHDNVLPVHHLSHVAGAVLFRQTESGLALSLDGGGDNSSWASVGLFEEGALKSWKCNDGSRLNFKTSRVERSLWARAMSIFRSKPIGTYWSEPCVFNYAMVDRKGRGGYEGKLMGLAGRGVPTNFSEPYAAKIWVDKRSKWIKTSGSGKLGDQKNIQLSAGPTSRKDYRLMQKQGNREAERDLNDPAELERASHFAAFLQKRTEEVVEEWIDTLHRYYGLSASDSLACAGGLFANVLMNGKLAKKYPISIMPGMGDEGLAMGAAVMGAATYNIDIHRPSLYLGLEEERLTPCTIEKAADLIESGQAVGIINGRMEFGPRALGNRSILADPRNPNGDINEKLGRKEYMPFAPIILAEYAAELLVDYRSGLISNSHMTLTYQVRNEWADRLPAVVHVDNSVRPQILSKDQNPQIYELIAKFYEKTGIPVLLNTSFNRHGEPILRDREDAIRAWKEGSVDAVCFGDKCLWHQ
jgi:carbamoyltransferase